MGFDSRSGRMAALAAAANMSPDERIARAKRANAARAVKAEERRLAKEKLSRKLTKKMKKGGYSPDAIAAELDRLGLGTRKSYPSNFVPSDDELEPYFVEVDARWPGLALAARKKQAIALLRADIARRESRAK